MKSPTSAAESPGDDGAADAVGSIVAAWQAQLPDLDASPLLVLGRIERVAALLDPLLRPPFAAAGLASGDFNVLAALRRSAPPHELSHGDLVRATLVTPGGVTKRIDRLLDAGLVTKTRDPADARGRRVALTEAGRQLADQLIRAHLSNEASLLEAALDDPERRQLASLLSKLLRSIEAGSNA